MRVAVTSKTAHLHALLLHGVTNCLIWQFYVGCPSWHKSKEDFCSAFILWDFFLLLFLLKKPNKSRDTKLCIFPWIFSSKCQMVRLDIFGGLTWNYVTLSFPGWPWKRQTQKMERDKKKRTWIVAQVWEHFTRPLVKHCPLVVTVYLTNSSQKNFKFNFPPYSAHNEISLHLLQ